MCVSWVLNPGDTYRTKFFIVISVLYTMNDKYIVDITLGYTYLPCRQVEFVWVNFRIRCQNIHIFSKELNFL